MPEQKEKGKKVSEAGLKVSEVLSQQINRHKLNSARVAKSVGVSKPAVGNWLNGLAIPKYPHVISLADLFKLHGAKREEFIKDMGYLSEQYSKRVTAKRVILLHALHTPGEQELITWLQEQLRHAGYEVKHEMEKNEEGVDLTLPVTVIPCLSPMNLHNEAFSEKISKVHQMIQNEGHGHLLSLYLDLEHTPLPQELSMMLSSAEAIYWNPSMDKTDLLRQIQEKLHMLRSQPVRSYELEMVGGAIPLDSKFYISRTADVELQGALARRDSIVLIKGPRQVGKTSLLARGLAQAREAGSVVLFTDFQRLIDAQLQDLETFFKAVGDILAEQLDLEFSLSEKWKKEHTANINFDRFFRREILGKTEKNVLWAIDEADKILPYPFSSDVFAMFRTWHNSRATFAETPCVRLTLAIAYSTEPYLFIKDLHQSPFNVGTKVDLRDFTLEQVSDLNQRHGCPLTSKELETFYQWVSGHPYLVRCALYELVRHSLPFTQFVQKIGDDEGIFGDHLRRIVMMLKRDETLHQAMCHILRQQPCPDYDTFFRLHSAGIVVGSKDAVKLRCKVYEQYLKRWLL